jgi:hypothetical protein
MQVFYLNVAYAYSGFKCFCRCFRRMFQMFYLFSDVCYNCCISIFQKLDRVLHLPPHLFLLSRLGGRCRKAEAAPTSAGAPHVLVDGRRWQDVGGQARDMGQRRLASGHPDASHADLYTYMCFSWSMSEY